jgi:hypothetical protein
MLERELEYVGEEVDELHDFVEIQKPIVEPEWAKDEVCRYVLFVISAPLSSQHVCLTKISFHLAQLGEHFQLGEFASKSAKFPI